MTINKIIDGGNLTLELEGRLDTITSPELDQVVKENIANISELVFDMKNLEYISSSGLRVLLSAQKTMMKQGTMVVRNVNDMINEVFEITGFSELLTIE